MTYEVRYGADAPLNTERAEDYLYVFCRGGNHPGVGADGDYPAYVSSKAGRGPIDRAPR